MVGSELRLPPRLDLPAVGPLWAELCARRGAPLTVDASAVERVGGLGAQVLLAAQAAWARDGLAFTLSAPSEACSRALEMLGASRLVQGEACA